MDDKDKQIQELTAQLATLTTANTDLTAQVDTLTIASSAATAELSKTKEQLVAVQADLAKATTTIADRDKSLQVAATDLAQAEQTVIDLKTKLAEKPAGVETLPQVKLGQVSYELTTGDFNYKGEIVTLERLKTDSALLKELIAESVSFVRKVSK